MKMLIRDEFIFFSHEKRKGNNEKWAENLVWGKMDVSEWEYQLEQEHKARYLKINLLWITEKSVRWT